MTNHNQPSSLDQQEQAGYHKGLSNRQVQMIGIGGAIGTGLFLGAGGRLASAGPAFLFSVLVVIGFHYPTGTYTVGTLVIIVPALLLGWYAVRGRVRELARQGSNQSAEPKQNATATEAK